jgi:hypothetical protein
MGLTKETKKSAEKGASLEGRGDVTRYRVGCSSSYAEVLLEASAGDSGSNECRVIAKPVR